MIVCKFSSEYRSVILLGDLVYEDGDFSDANDLSHPFHHAILWSLMLKIALI